MDNILEITSKISSGTNVSNQSLHPVRVQQAIKAVCALMGHVETVDITESLNSFIQTCATLSASCHLDDFRTKVTSDDGDYSTVQIASSSLRCLKENLLVQCDRVREALRGLIESYCHAFNVDFQLNLENQPSSGKFLILILFLRTYHFFLLIIITVLYTNNEAFYFTYRFLQTFSLCGG